MAVDNSGGIKRRYGFGTEILEASNDGQLVPAKKQKNDSLALMNDQQLSLASVVCI